MEIVLAILGGGFVTQVFNWLFGGRRANFIDDAEQIVKLMREQVDSLSDEVKSLRSEVSNLRALVGALEHEIVSLGGDPKRVREELARRQKST